MYEILAPAGDKNSAFAAINGGADAIYLGLKQFSARSSANNFSFDELKEIADYAALFGIKVYVALNTLVKQNELEDFFSAACAAWNAGADALIIQDIFLGRALKKRFPHIILHLSTQAGICNEYGARLAKEYGFSRVILARETAFEDIKRIAAIIETEVFVQGALCTCFSGQCYLSSFAGGNSGNRGKCKQPCRKLYSIDRKGFEEPAYRLSPSDLCVAENIVKLAESGVYSFKIEGRMRRPEYVSAAVEFYKNILGGEKGDVSALKRTYNRGNYTRGLAFGQDKSFLSSSVQGHLGEYVGTVKVLGGRFFCESREKFLRGDGFKILRGGKELCGGFFESDGKGGFYLSASSRLKNGDKVFITTDSALNERLLSKKRTLNVVVNAFFEEGGFPEAEINGIRYKGTEKLISAENRPLSVEDVKNCFTKVGPIPLKVQFGDVVVSGRPYLGMAALNSFRRASYDKFLSCMTFKPDRNISGAPKFPVIRCCKNDKKAVICTNLNGVKADIGILKLSKFSVDAAALVSDFKGEKYLYVPAYLSGTEIEQVIKISCFFDGLYCEGTFGIILCRELNKPLFAGTGFNITNTFSADAVEAKYYCISKELSLREARGLFAENAFYLSCGGLKVMDLIYCPFRRDCSVCDKREKYTLTDESGRKFTLRRYETSLCRFELYNCANILCASGDAGVLADFTLGNASVLSATTDDESALKRMLGECTRGHSVSPVF